MKNNQRRLKPINVLTMLLVLSIGFIMWTTTAKSEPGNLATFFILMSWLCVLSGSGCVYGWHTGRVLRRRLSQSQAAMISALVSLVLYIGFCLLFILLCGPEPDPDPDNLPNFSIFLAVTGLFNAAIGCLSGNSSAQPD
jgi:hypothetical protein